MLNYQGSGMSVMEMSHRSKVYDDIIVSAENLMHEVMNIPQDYKVLFLQGGATLQFAMVPMNLMVKNNKADYVRTGSFSTKASEEAEKYGKVNIAATTKSENFSRIPQQGELNLDLTPTMFIFATIIRFSALYGTIFPILEACRLLLICPRA